MTLEEWSAVDAAVACALDLPPAAREAFLEQYLAGRAHLVGEALSLLAYDGEDRADPIVLRDPGDWSGRRVGHYLITGKAGEGGMGVVWRARRDDGRSQRRVAVKFLHCQAPAAFTLERFLKERDILARLDHPNIARLLDAGFADSTAGGGARPYLVLDWVEGTPIDAYVRESLLSPAAILRLFRQVCGAIDYAHRQLVVHRDIKPSNVLVTPAGEVKLLDFGIARMLDAGLPGERTATIGRAFTPDYSSPQQLRGEPASTADDVYSLGALLYELLAGERPFRAGRVPPPPPGVLRQGIPPEIDAIVLKALRAEPAERYGSAAELLADIDRFMEGRPVLARPAGAWYAAGKFVRRHRWPVAAAALAVALVATSALVAVRQRNRAERRFAQLRQLAHSVIFEFQSDISRLPGTLAVRQKMVKRSLEYLDSLALDARNDPQLLLELGRGYQELAIAQGKPSAANLSDFPGALESIRKARQALERLLALQPRNFEAACDLGDVLFNIANIAARVPSQDAQAARREGVAYWEKLAARYPDRQRALNGQAAAMFYKPDYETALSLYEQLAVRFPNGPGYSHDIALLCRTLANATSDPARMRTLSQRALALDRQRLAAQPLDRGARLDLSFDLLALAQAYQQAREYRVTLPLVLQAVAMREELHRLAPDDEQATDRLMFACNKLAWLYGQLHQYDDCARYYRRTLALGEEMSRRNPPPNQPYQQWIAGARTGLEWAVRPH